jgi:hypothetical protein
MVGGFCTGSILADPRLSFSCFEGLFSARCPRRPGDFANIFFAYVPLEPTAIHLAATA